MLACTPSAQSGTASEVCDQTHTKLLGASAALLPCLLSSCQQRSAPADNHKLPRSLCEQPYRPVGMAARGSTMSNAEAARLKACCRGPQISFLTTSQWQCERSSSTAAGAAISSLVCKVTRLTSGEGEAAQVPVRASRRVSRWGCRWKRGVRAGAACAAEQSQRGQLLGAWLLEGLLQHVPAEGRLREAQPWQACTPGGYERKQGLIVRCLSCVGPGRQAPASLAAGRHAAAQPCKGRQSEVKAWQACTPGGYQST